MDRGDVVPDEEWAPPEPARPRAAQAPGPTPTTPAAVVSGYTDLVEIARGGDSIVYRARQVSLDRDVAIKVVQLSDPSAVARFQRELAITVRLGRAHPHIVTVLDTTTTAAGEPCLIMDFHDLGSLHDRLVAQGPLSASEVVEAGTAVADALAFAHAAGVLHRDVKPQNILVLPTSYVLSDFGIARGMDADRTASLERFSYRHASPQVLDGLAPTAADDVWSLGSTLFTLLEGRAPFAADDPDDDTALAYLRRVRLNERRPMRRTDLPAGLREVVDGCLAPDRADRIPAAEQALAMLRGIRTEGRSWQPTDASAPARGVAPVAVAPVTEDVGVAERPVVVAGGPEAGRAPVPGASGTGEGPAAATRGGVADTATDERARTGPSVGAPGGSTGPHVAAGTDSSTPVPVADAATGMQRPASAEPVPASADSALAAVGPAATAAATPGAPGDPARGPAGQAPAPATAAEPAPTSPSTEPPPLSSQAPATAAEPAAAPGDPTVALAPVAPAPNSSQPGPAEPASPPAPAPAGPPATVARSALADLAPAPASVRPAADDEATGTLAALTRDEPATPSDRRRGGAWRRVAFFLGGMLLAGAAIGVATALLQSHPTAPHTPAAVDTTVPSAPASPPADDGQPTVSNPAFAPRNLVVTDRGTSALLTWAAPQRDVEFLVVVQVDAGSSPVVVAHLPATATDYTVEGLNPDVPNCFAVAGYGTQDGAAAAGSSLKVCTH
ncbi:protein kinase domain-containing protein [Microbacterium luticocti]|uniref:protein kinase domain-containing protein n=1 Tax=Microbacterium luticocti TaxID=451764 RepID=UPI001B7FC75E|nr:protein kinase [Microbacterium luticocti]